MKHIITTAIIILCIFFRVQAQKDRVYEPFEFENYTPVWKHIVIDTSLTGTFKAISIFNGDSIFYDGFSHFNSGDIVKVLPLFYQNKIIITELNNSIACNGAFIQCLDIKTGKVLWQTAYDLRTESRKEWPTQAYINKEGQLEILGHRWHGLLPNPIAPFWRYSLLTVRKYNIDTGQLEGRIIIDEKDEKAKIMQVPFSVALVRIIGSYLYPYGDGYQYISPALTSYIMDKSSYVTDSTTADASFTGNMWAMRLYKTPGDKFIHLLYTSSQLLENKKDTFELYYKLNDRNLNLIKSLKLGDKLKPAYDYYFFYYNDDNYFVILGKDYILKEGEQVPLMTYSMFDLDGKLIEEITLKDEYGNPYKYYNDGSGVVLKLKNEGGMLIITDEENDDGYRYLNIFKTDGKGNYSQIKRLKVSDRKHGVGAIDGFYTSEGDIVLKIFDGNDSLYNKQYVGYATGYLMISAEDLGLKTNTTGVSANIHINISPNPASELISISCNDSESGLTEIFDQLGRLMIREKMLSCEEKNIDISGLSSGFYFVRLLDESGSVVGRGKFVKE